MESYVIGLIGLAVLLALMLLGVPISFSFFLVGGVGIYLIGGLKALSLLATTPWAWSTDFTMMSIPLFVMMGYLMYQSGVGADLYEVCYNWFGHFPGGLAMATTLACACFAAVCGSSMATAAAMGAVSIPEMHKRNYKSTLIGGSVAAGGTLGILIPPSIPFIIYGLIVERPVGTLFIAGILPGILLTFLYILTIYIQVKKNPALAPLVPPFSWKERFISLRYFWGAALIFLLVMGGIYGGIFTPTEAAAIGCSGAFVLTIVRGRFNKSTIQQAILASVRTTSMIFLIFIGGTVFNAFIALSGMAREIATFFSTLPLPPLVILSFILFTYIPLGCLMDSLALLVLTTPIYLPIFNLFGFDLIWVGVLMVILIEIGLITPPMGLNLFVIKDVSASSKQISLREVYKGVVPFIMIDVVALAILVIFPGISLFLPRLMR